MWKDAYSAISRGADPHIVGHSNHGGVVVVGVDALDVEGLGSPTDVRGRSPRGPAHWPGITGRRCSRRRVAWDQRVEEPPHVFGEAHELGAAATAAPTIDIDVVTPRVRASLKDVEAILVGGRDSGVEVVGDERDMMKARSAALEVLGVEVDALDGLDQQSGTSKVSVNQRSEAPMSSTTHATW